MTKAAGTFDLASWEENTYQDLDAGSKLTMAAVTQKFEGDIAGAQRHGMRTVLVRTGKFRPDDLEESGVHPDGIVSSIAQLPDWLERSR